MRTFFVFLLALWLGGFTFYAGFVIPVGSDVLGGHRAFGFITREVTPRLNWIGAVVAAVILVRLLTLRFSAGKPSPGRLPWIALGVFAAAQLALFFLHPWIDGLLDPATRGISDADAFYRRHQIYLWTAAIQWMAAIVLLQGLVTARQTEHATWASTP